MRKSLWRIALCLGLCTTAMAQEAPSAAWSLPAASDPLHVFLIRGLWSREYRIEEAFSRMGGGFLDDGWAWDGAGSGWLGPGDQGAGGLNFPDAAGLMRCHAVIAVNVNAKAFGDNPRLLLDYVRHGGSVLFLGGRFAFGKQYAESAFAELAPVIFPGQQRWGSDLQSSETGVELAPGPDRLDPDFSACPWDQKPLLFWYQDVVPKPGSRTLLTADGKPILVVGEFVKGRVAIFAGTVMGDPAAGQLPFWKWEAWPRVLAATLNWLTEAPRKAGPLPTDAWRRRVTQALEAQEAESLTKAAVFTPAGQAAFLDMANRCRSAEDAAFLLTATTGIPGDIPADLAETLESAILSYPTATLAAPAQQLLQSGRPYKTALGAAALGSTRDRDAVAFLDRLHQSGKPEEKASDDLSLDDASGADGLDNMGLKPVLPQDQANETAAIRLAALAGLGSIGSPEALSAIRRALAMHAGGAPRPKDYADVLTRENRLYQQALVAALRCGDATAAAPFVDAFMEDVYTSARARMEANKSEERLQEVHRTLPAQIRWQQHLLHEVARVPEAALPALARRVAQEQDRRIAPVAWAAFCGRGSLSPEVLAALRTSTIPAVAALAAAR